MTAERKNSPWGRKPRTHPWTLEGNICFVCLRWKGNRKKEKRNSRMLSLRLFLNELQLLLPPLLLLIFPDNERKGIKSGVFLWVFSPWKFYSYFDCCRALDAKNEKDRKRKTCGRWLQLNQGVGSCRSGAHTFNPLSEPPPPPPPPPPTDSRNCPHIF